MNAPSAIIAEDEPLLRAEIRDALRTLWPELKIQAEVGDGLSAIEALDRFAPTVAFLDIQMPGVSGLDVAQHASGKSHVIFITAFDEYALAAFERGALDYILKPLAIERVKLTVMRLQERLRDTPANLENLVGLLKAAGGGEPRYLKWLTVPQGSELRVVAVADISYLRADNKYTTVATRSSTFLLTSSLKEMRDKLDPAMFWQIHRGTIVNVAAIDTIYRSFRGSLELRLKDRGELLAVSAAHAHLFKPP
ncbi:MAG TPA: LytTR family DNA-binding domain-containing protein [Steroidobacteraceae bacterium]|jgi:DNA-binding LytR/AlgR family response regulator